MVPVEEKPSGLLVDMVKSVKSSIDKGVQKIKDLVKPKESETYELYDARPPPVKTYSLGITYICARSGLSVLPLKFLELDF